MKKIILGILFVCSTIVAQEASKYKVYGFADMGVEAYDNSSSFMNQFAGKDTINLKLNHANVYFDFSPNQHIRALVEVGFFSEKSKNYFEIGQDASIFVDDNGNRVPTADVIDMVTAAKTPGVIDSVAASLGLTAEQLEAAQPAVVAGIRSQVRASVAEQLTAAKAPEQKTKTQTISIERAYFDFLINDHINIRTGKFITPAGIWNVDHASPVILTVRQPLQTSITPIFPESQLGLMLYGKHYLGDHDLNYNAYVTSGRSDYAAAALGSGYDNAIDKPSDLAFGGHLGLKLDVLKGISIGASAMTGTLREKFKTQQASVALTSLGLGEVEVTNLKIVDNMAKEEREFIYGGDMKIEVANLTVQGECNYRNIDNEIEKGSTSMLGYYGLLAYRFPIGTEFSITPYGMYENVSWESTKAASRTIDDNGINGFYTVLTGINFSLFTNYKIKMEYARLQLLLNEGSTGFPTGVGESDLYSNIFSTQFSVAF